MPMGILEAMSYGLPCLVTRGTSLGELIEKYDAGWVCETNSESIANCIMRCIQEKELFKIKGQNVRRLIKENFTWEKVARETIDKYKELIDYEGE
jgi:glycosyltransferase involved in cell wall biosynthesis